MPTALPPASDFTGAAVTEGGFKTAITNLRAFLSDLLGADGTAATARTALGVMSNAEVAAAIAIGELTGVVKDYVGATAPTGYVMLSGRTIGDASSGATERANADTSALFTLLWNSMGNTEAPVSGGRGASASADFAAHKTITLPDARGRAIVGKDNMGGTTASRITAAGSGITGTTLGTSGGAETHTLTTAELAVHSHSQAYPDRGYNPAGGGTYGVTINANNQGSDNTNGNAGSGSAHNNQPPSLVLNKIIKL